MKSQHPIGIESTVLWRSDRMAAALAATYPSLRERRDCYDAIAGQDTQPATVPAPWLAIQGKRAQHYSN